jgi:hypothetical protein
MSVVTDVERIQLLVFDTSALFAKTLTIVPTAKKNLTTITRS